MSTLTKKQKKPGPFKPNGPERIAKRIARAGICSRREAEVYIADGRVTLNGTVLTSPAVSVSPDDIVLVDGKTLNPPEPARLWRYYKPRGLVVSNKDEKGRETIFSHLPEGLPRVISVGRLDIDSEGLLLLTNDGDLARHLELPATGWMRKYRVRVHGRVDEKKLEAIAQGVSVDAINYGPVLARLDTQMTSNAWLTVGIREGRNREVRKIMEHLGYPVTRLLRLSYGPFLLGKLAPGQAEEVKAAVLSQQLGLACDPEQTNAGEEHAGAKKQPAQNKKLSLRRRNRPSRTQPGTRPRRRQEKTPGRTGR